MNSFFEDRAIGSHVKRSNCSVLNYINWTFRPQVDTRPDLVWNLMLQTDPLCVRTAFSILHLFKSYLEL